MKLLLLSLLILFSCATNHKQDKESGYYWVSGKKINYCQKAISSNIDSIMAINSLRNCTRLESRVSAQYLCNETKGTTTLLVTSSERDCYSALRNELGIEAYGSKETFSYKGVEFYEDYRFIHKSKKGELFWSYGFLKDSSEAEITKAIGLDRKTELHAERFIIPARDPSARFRPGKRVKFIQALSDQIVEVDIDGESYFVINGRFKGFKPNFYASQPVFEWTSTNRSEEERMIGKGQLFEGMTVEAFRALLIDKHFKVNQYNSGRMEQWVTSDNKELYYFRAGKLVSWQRFNK